MLVFAHRGASGEAPENTLAAFELAIDQQAHGIELDVYEHDGQFWVIHDASVDRTTNRTGKLYDFDKDAIKRLDAGKGQRIPTLKEALVLLGGRCFLNIEVKGLSDVQLLQDHIQFAQQTCSFSSEQLLISSFNHHYLKRIKSALPNIQIGALTASVPIQYAKFAHDLNAYSVHANLGFINQEFVDDATARNLKTFVYTVDKAEDIKAMQALGVDGIFTNHPAQALEVIAELE